MFISLLGCLASLVISAQAKLQLLGVAIPGIDFGCDIDGTCPVNSGSFPLKGFGGSDGIAQMRHFAADDGINLFRLPVSWQFLLNSTKLGTDIDAKQLDNFDLLVQGCLDTGAYCMIDLHNFARYDGGIIGQGGPTNDQFAEVWSQLAKKYRDADKVVFNLMNEPHDLDVDLWADSCQAAVTAIRKAGATSQMILLPGTNFVSAETLVSSGSADALLAVTNPDGSTDNLLLDIHKYLDQNNSGQFAACTTDNVAAFHDLAAYLRRKKRKGLVSETGASSDASCVTAFCAQNEEINANDDVYVGMVAWAAGSFDTSYLLSLTPTRHSDGSWSDHPLFSKCVLAPWGGPHPRVLPSPTSTAAAPTATPSKKGGAGGSSASVSPPKSTAEDGGDESGSGSDGGDGTGTEGQGAKASGKPSSASGWHGKLPGCLSAIVLVLAGVWCI